MPDPSWACPRLTILNCRLMRPDPLVPRHLDNRDPQYLVVSGLLFNVLSGGYVSSMRPSTLLCIAPCCLHQGRWGLSRW